MQQERRWVLRDFRFMEYTPASGSETASRDTHQGATPAARYQSADRSGSIEVTVDDEAAVMRSTFSMTGESIWSQRTSRRRCTRRKWSPCGWQKRPEGTSGHPRGRLSHQSPRSPELSMPQTPEQRALLLDAVSDALNQIDRSEIHVEQDRTGSWRWICCGTDLSHLGSLHR